MNVTLVSSTPNATKAVARAAHICTHPDWPTEHDLHPDRAGPLVRRVLASGHDSILEHAGFNFTADGISRTCSHQLVRHRVASYSQQSQRYVAESGECVIPQTIHDDLDMRHAFNQFYACATDLYATMVERGIPAEDARFVLPNAAATKLVITMNARELHHFFALRMCTRAQWEIRELAAKMLELCQAAQPVLFADCGPGCLRGPCPEGKRTCGKPWKGQELGRIAG